MYIEITNEERELTKNLMKQEWGEPNGWTKDSGTGYTAYTKIIQTLGRRFIRGRVVWHLPNETRLGDDYFLPAGRYGGCILS